MDRLAWIRDRENFRIYQDSQVQISVRIQAKIFWTTLLLSSLFIYPTDAQLDCYRKCKKFTLNLQCNAPTCFGFTTIIRELQFVFW